MSFAGAELPSAAWITVSRDGGAPGFTGASSLSDTPVTIRMVAVAWTAAETGCPDDCGVASAAAVAARMTIINTANALGVKW